MILLNAIQCVACKDVITSRNVHEYKTCGCGRVAVDGGREYLARSYSDDIDFVELSVVSEGSLKDYVPRSQE